MLDSFRYLLVSDVKANRQYTVLPLRISIIGVYYSLYCTRELRCQPLHLFYF